MQNRRLFILSTILQMIVFACAILNIRMPDNIICFWNWIIRFNTKYLSWHIRWSIQYKLWLFPSIFYNLLDKSVWKSIMNFKSIRIMLFVRFIVIVFNVFIFEFCLCRYKSFLIIWELSHFFIKINSSNNIITV